MAGSRQEAVRPAGARGIARARPPLRRRARSVYLACLAPFGYLAFVLALAALSLAARLLGEEHALGYFAGRLNDTIWRYPEVTRRGVQMAWLVWIALFFVALSPLDPIGSRWDEVALGVLALGVLLRQTLRPRRAER